MVRATRLAAQAAEAVDSKGIYPVAKAAALLKVRPDSIRRWAFGYNRRAAAQAPAIHVKVPEFEGKRVLIFLDLVELMFIQALLKSGLSWRKVRDASRVAAQLLPDAPHPFATRQWFVDSAALYLSLGKEHDASILVEVAGHAQVAMEPVLRPYLHQLEFDESGVAQRWYPQGQGTSIVVDPRRAFGMPIVARGGVPTDTIAALNRSGDSVETIAAWYRIDESDVRAAVNFESSIAAA